MRIADSFLVKASQAEVWKFLFDIPRLSRCIPGIESVEALDDRTYRGRMIVRVGPIRSEFTGIVRLTEIQAPDRIAGIIRRNAVDQNLRIVGLTAAHEERGDLSVAAALCHGEAGHAAHQGPDLHLGFGIVGGTAVLSFAVEADCAVCVFPSNPDAWGLLPTGGGTLPLPGVPMPGKTVPSARLP